MKDTTKSSAAAIAAGQSIEEREYWLEKLSGNIQKSHFPYDMGKTNETGHQPAHLELQLPTDLCTAVNHLAKGSLPKVFIILAAGLVELVYKYTAHPDIILGTSIYKQDREGEYINTVLPLRQRRTPGMTFKDLLNQVRETVIEANKNQNFPIAALFYELEIAAPGEEFPLFDIVLLLENIHSKAYVRHTQPSVYFSFTAADSSMHLDLEYNSLLYRQETPAGIVRHYFSLLGQMLTRVNLALDDISMLTPEEKQRLLVDFNETAVSYPEDRTIHELYEEQAARTPDSAALLGQSPGHKVPGKDPGPVPNTLRGVLTYRELNERSNRLARLLREKGVKPDTLVGLLLESSLEMVTGIIAILKSGGAYLPLDIAYPRQRISYMLKDSQTLIMLTRRHFAGPGEFIGQQVYPGPGIMDQGNPANPPPISGPGNLAYVIYTSGTSGKPKGTAIQHRSILNYIQWRIKAYGHTAADIGYQLVPPAFDGFCANLYPTLLTGGKLVLQNDEKWAEAEYIKNIIKQEHVTNFSVVPSMYKFIIQGVKPGELRSLVFVALAGEKASRQLIERSRDLAPHLKLINEYGPTETSVATAAYFGMTPDNLDIIGKPAFNQSLYILDENQRLNPIGVPGEIYISGKGLMRGYINQPELTHEKLIPHPFKPGARIYRSGDLARWLPRGDMQILGRIDEQVKVRGTRIEPGEIENQLRCHQDITDAVVTALDIKHGDAPTQDPGDKNLYAYVVTSRELTETEIKDFLAARLPAYMIPAQFITLEEIPLMPNGKVNREALPQPRPDAAAAYVPPGNPEEEKLVEMWADLLELEKETIGINHNFFNLGGHSLKASMLVTKIQQHWGVQIPLVDIFQTPTIKELAPYIRAGNRTDPENDNPGNDNRNLVLLRQGTQPGKQFFLIHPGTGVLDGYVDLCRHLYPGFTIRGIKADTIENYTPVNLTIPGIAGKYIKLIKSLQDTGPYYLAGWCCGGTITFEIVRQLEQAGEKAAFFAVLSSIPPSKELTAQARSFTLADEIEWVYDYLPGNEIKEKVKKIEELNQLWPTIVDFIEEQDLDLEKIREVIHDFGEAMPNFYQLDRKQLIYFLNVIRSISDARCRYVPPGKIKARTCYIQPRESKHSHADTWSQYIEPALEVFEVPGDHYSILAEPNVRELAGIFNRLI